MRDYYGVNDKTPSKKKELRECKVCKQTNGTHHWPHASCLGLVAPTPGDLAPDLVVQLHDVLDRRLVLDLTAGHVVAAGVQVVGTFGTQTLDLQK